MGSLEGGWDRPSATLCIALLELLLPRPFNALSGNCLLRQIRNVTVRPPQALQLQMRLHLGIRVVALGFALIVIGRSSLVLSYLLGT